MNQSTIQVFMEKLTKYDAKCGDGTALDLQELATSMNSMAVVLQAKAENTLFEAIKRDPNDFGPHLSLASFYFHHVKEPDKAIDHAKKALAKLEINEPKYEYYRSEIQWYLDNI